MAKVDISRNSWLNFSDFLEIDAVQGVSGSSQVSEVVSFWETPEFPQIVPQENDIFTTITDQSLGRLDLIAFDAYGDPELWWVIALANNMDLLPTDMVVNQRIRIPNKAYVDSLISGGQQR